MKLGNIEDRFTELEVGKMNRLGFRGGKLV